MDIILIPGLWLDGSSWHKVVPFLERAGHRVVALTPEQQTVGLMFRPAVPPDGGMLFDWGTPRDSAMWMRNTISSLDMVFIAADGRIHRIAERTVPLSLATVSSGGPVRATLELAAGVTERLDIRAGDRVLHPMFGTAP